MHEENLTAPTQDLAVSDSSIVSSQIGGQTGRDSMTAQHAGSGDVIQNVYINYINNVYKGFHLPLPWDSSRNKLSAKSKVAKPNSLSENVQCLMRTLPREGQQGLSSSLANAKFESDVEPEHFDEKVRNLVQALPREGQQGLSSSLANAKPESDVEPEHFDEKVRNLVQALPAGNPQLA